MEFCCTCTSEFHVYFGISEKGIKMTKAHFHGILNFTKIKYEVCNTFKPVCVLWTDRVPVYVQDWAVPLTMKR